MANQPCPNIAQVTFKLVADAQDIQNSLYFEKSGGWAAGDMTTLAAAAEAQFIAQMLADYCADVRFHQVIAVDLTSLTTERAVTTPDFGNVGTHLGQSMPNSVCIALQVSTGSRGRGKQGRIFHGPLPEDVVNQDLVDATFADAVVQDWLGVVDACLVALPGITHVVLSRYAAGVKRPDGIGLPALDIAYSNLYIDVQKDRLPFHKKRRKKITTP